MKAKDATILIVPGLEPAGSNIWYNRWADRIGSARALPAQDSEDFRNKRLATLLSEIERSSKPVVLVGHGLGTITILDLAGRF
jgi:predicted alpha/beta hydrolase family esterase